MVPLLSISGGERGPMVGYSVGPDEQMTEAVVEAFLAANVDVYDRDTTLHDWINPEALESFDWPGKGPTFVSTRVWNHPVVTDGETVWIYATDVEVADRPSR